MGPPSASPGQSRFAPARAFDAVPLFHAAWLFAAGVALAHWLWLRPPLVLLALALLIALTLCAALRAQRVLFVPLAGLWILLGAWCAEMEPQPGPAARLMSLSDGLLRTVEGTIVHAGPLRSDTDPEGADTLSQTIDVRLSTVEFVDDLEDRQMPVEGGVRLTVHWPHGVAAQRYACGDGLRAVVRLLPPQIYRDPGAWSRADYLLDQGITSTASVASDRVQDTGGGGGASLACRLAEAQQSAAARLLGLPRAMRGWPAWLRLSPPDAIMLTAMVTGDRTFLSRSLRAGFERTGSFHMLVVSGLHLAIVAGLVLLIARKLRIPRVPATAMTLAAAFAYALFTGFAAPVQRSLWMVSLYLIGRLLYRDRNALNLIGFAALCLLVASPRSLFDASLQMTLLAVVAIAGVAAPLLNATVHPYLNATRDLSLVAVDAKLTPAVAQFRVLLRMFAARVQRVSSRGVAWNVFPAAMRMGLRVLEGCIVAVVVELAMTLPMAMYFHRITLLALPVNLFILPLLLVLMPAALLTMLALLAWPAAAVVPGAVTACLLHIGVGLVQVFVGLRWSDVRTATPLPLQMAGFVLLLAAALMLARSPARWMRRGTWITLLGAALIAVMPRPMQHPQGALLVEVIDVGQGDSLLLITPAGKTLLVDAGGFGGGARTTAQEFDIGEEVVSAALWARGIRHLDVAALSHAHSDHMGGMPAILRNFHPDELWIGKNPPSAAYDALLGQAALQHTRVRQLVSGDQLALGDTRIHVLAPTRDYRPGAEASNDDSLVLHVAYRGTSVLLEGDAEAPVEQAMLAEPGLQSQLLKVGHHGSTTSTQPAFLARVAPQWAVISCGLRNRYGHPRVEVLNELEEAGVRTSSTDIEGAVCFRLDGVSVQRESGCGADGGP